MDEAGCIDGVNDGMEVDLNSVPDDDEDDYVDEEEGEEESESESDDPDYEPPVFKRRSNISDIDFEKYLKQVKDSKGFDVDPVPGSTPFNSLITAVPIKGHRKFFSRLVRYAIHRHNRWTKGKGIMLTTLVKANFQPSPPSSYYITFEGKDLADDKIKTYQTCLVTIPGVGKKALKLFRQKPPANLGGCENLLLNQLSLSVSANECEVSKMPSDSDSDSDSSLTCKHTEFLDRAYKAGIYHFVQQFCKSSCKKTIQYPLFRQGVQKLSLTYLERYYREVQESEGYDVSLLPGMGWYDLITPIPRPWSKCFRKCVQRCARLAIKYFNQKEGAQLKLLKIVKVNTNARAPYLYITFVAKDSVDGEAKTYQARLLLFTRREEQVREVRAKPNVKDNSGRRS